MLRTALLAAGIPAVLFACALPPPSPPPHIGRVNALGGCNAVNFAGAVQVLSGYVFDPNNYSPPYKNVNQNATLASISSQASTDLQSAFTNAPPYFQNYLCALDGIYINPPTGAYPDFANSFGFRSFVTNAPDLGSRYIGISSSLWPDTTHSAKLLSQYQNSLISYFANWGGPSVTSMNPPDPDTPAMTLLAVLAHEAGHIRWAEIVAPNGAGTPYDFTKLKKCNVGGGQKDFFENWTYSTDAQLEPPDRWQAFGPFGYLKSAAGSQTDHAQFPKLADFNNSPGAARSNYLTFALYQASQPWPSMFGTQTPNEDFVETYAIRVLMGNKLENNGQGNGYPYLKSLPITIPGYTGPKIKNQQANVPDDFLGNRKSGLKKKADCLHGYDPP
jgi:hypothetical protein